MQNFLMKIEYTISMLNVKVFTLNGPVKIITQNNGIKDKCNFPHVLRRKAALKTSSKFRGKYLRLIFDLVNLQHHARNIEKRAPSNGIFYILRNFFEELFCKTSPSNCFCKSLIYRDHWYFSYWSLSWIL